MKRSENVGLIVMGGAAFAVTFAAGMTYLAWQKSSHATPAQAAQSCTPQPGAQTCEPARRGFAYYLFPSWSSSREPARPQQASFSGNTRTASASHTSGASSSGGVERSGFGSNAKGSFRVSAGG